MDRQQNEAPPPELFQGAGHGRGVMRSERRLVFQQRLQQQTQKPGPGSGTVPPFFGRGKQTETPAREPTAALGIAAAAACLLPGSSSCKQRQENKAPPPELPQSAAGRGRGAKRNERKLLLQQWLQQQDKKPGPRSSFFGQREEEAWPDLGAQDKPNPQNELDSGSPEEDPFLPPYPPAPPVVGIAAAAECLLPGCPDSMGSLSSSDFKDDSSPSADQCPLCPRSRRGLNTAGPTDRFPRSWLAQCVLCSKR